jgi:hypothetical protein
MAVSIPGSAAVDQVVASPVLSGWRGLAIAVLLCAVADARAGLLERHPVDWDACATWAEAAGVSTDTLRERLRGAASARLDPAEARVLAPWRPRRARARRPELVGRRGHAVAPDGVITARLTDAAATELRRRAAAEGVPPGTLARRWLEAAAAAWSGTEKQG